MLEHYTIALSGNAALDALIGALSLIVAAYLARRPAHQVIRSVFLALRRLLRVLGRYCAHAEYHVRAWTRSVLVARARWHAAARADWNVEQFAAELRTELADLPRLQQTLREQLSMVEADYRGSGAVPPEIPGWPRLLEQLGPEVATADPSVRRTLEDLRDGLETQRVDLLDAYRRATRRRYLLLHRTMPHWRRVRRAVDQMSERLERLRDRADRVVRAVQGFDALRDEQHVRTTALAGASVARLALASAGLAVAGLGILVLARLLREPLDVLLGTVPVADGLPGLGGATTGLGIAAVLLLGAILLETCRLGRLFGGIEALAEPLRRWLFWLSFCALVLLAGAGALVTLQYGGVPPTALAAPWSAAAAPYVAPILALLLPFSLVFTPLALLGVMDHGRIVAGMVVALVLQILVLAFRLLASLAAVTGSVALQLYDLVIFLPLWVEDLVRSRGWRPRDGLQGLPRRLPLPRPARSERS